MADFTNQGAWVLRVGMLALVALVILMCVLGGGGASCSGRGGDGPPRSGRGVGGGGTHSVPSR
jgi:hypothetical protein